MEISIELAIKILKGDVLGTTKQTHEAVKMAVKALQESEWTLCSNRMPKEHEWIGSKVFGTTISDEVYITFENSDGRRFVEHTSFQNGDLCEADKEAMGVFTYNKTKPIAWKPLPEPYMGDK